MKSNQIAFFLISLLLDILEILKFHQIVLLSYFIILGPSWDIPFNCFILLWYYSWTSLGFRNPIKFLTFFYYFSSIFLKYWNSTRLFYFLLSLLLDLLKIKTFHSIVIFSDIIFLEPSWGIEIPSDCFTFLYYFSSISLRYWNSTRLFYFLLSLLLDLFKINTTLLF